MSMYAGAARGDITPAQGIQLAGDIGRWRPVEEIRDRLYANLLLVRQNEQTVCIVSLDLLATTTAWSDRIREVIAEEVGIAAEEVLLTVTQNHAAPCVGHFFVKDSCRLIPDAYPWLRGGDDRYNPQVLQVCRALAQEALAAMCRVTLHAGRAIEGSVAFNRRHILRDGQVRTQGSTASADILCHEGPADPEVGVVLLRDGAQKVVAGLLHFTSHPCHGYPHRYVIGDWPGEWASLMAQRWGGTAVPLVLNGCCGNVIHQNCLDPSFRSEYRAMASKLAAAADRAEFTSQSGSLEFRRTLLHLPLRELDPQLVADAKAMIEAHPEPIWLDEERTRVQWDWVYAVARLDLADTISSSPTCPYEVQAIRLGDTCLVSLMGEPFVEAQLEIKRRSPAPFTLVAHFSNGYAGYVPTAAALTRGGYETRTANWSKFKPEALRLIAEAALELADGLWESECGDRPSQDVCGIHL